MSIVTIARIVQGQLAGTPVRGTLLAMLYLRPSESQVEEKSTPHPPRVLQECGSKGSTNLWMTLGFTDSSSRYIWPLFPHSPADRTMGIQTSAL